MVEKRCQNSIKKERMLSFLYQTTPGRSFLKVLCAPSVSKIVGIMLDSRLSRLLITPFVRYNDIDMTLFERRRFHSYNDFFTRKLVPGARNIDMVQNHLISPCDGKLSAYRIKSDSTFHIKGTRYALSELLKNKELAKRFSGGLCLVFRLCVDDYHRYVFFDDGITLGKVRIDGALHTVRPIALAHCNVYKENSREYTLQKTDNFGLCIYMEIGAMLVGKIVNHPLKSFSRGDEKGYFEFGGSTIVLLLQKNTAKPDGLFLENTKAGIETAVKLGQKIGRGYDK